MTMTTILTGSLPWKTDLRELGLEHVHLSADLVSAQHTGNRANVRLGVTYANVGVLGSVCTSGHYCEVVLVTLGVN